MKKELEEAKTLAETRIKNYNMELVASLKESDKSNEEVELLKEANKVLENRLAQVRASIKENSNSEDFKAKYDELKESYDKLKYILQDFFHKLLYQADLDEDYQGNILANEEPI